MDDLTPMMRQYHRIKLEHPEVLLFFRLGDFYEMFYEDAVLGSRELEITLTSRNKDRQGNPIPMCGIPHHALTNYTSRLLKKGFKVAVCEQVEDPRKVKGIVRREVTRILTPGTAIEEGMLEIRENNFLAGIVTAHENFGIAFLDVSTGDFWVSEYSGENAWEKTAQDLLQFRPRELVLAESLREELGKRALPVLTAEAVMTPVPDWVFNADYSQRCLLQQFRVSTLDGFGIMGRPLALAAAGGVIHYVKMARKSELNHISGLQLVEDAGFLAMDESTIRNLELVQGVDGNRKWTLLATLDQTRTGMGARLLRRWVLRPSLDLGEIERRLDAVEELKGELIKATEIGRVLACIQDLERLLGRITGETAGPRDLLALRESLRHLPELERALVSLRSELLRSPLETLGDVTGLLERAVDDDAPASISEGRIFRPGYNAELDELRDIARSGKSFIARIEAEEKEKTGIPSLKVKYNRVFGYFIEVTKSHLKSVPEHYIRKQTLAGAERYLTPELKEYEEKVLGAEERMSELEKELFQSLRSTIAAQADRIQTSARTIALVDVLLALAEGARRNRYVRPVLNTSLRLDIGAGRHPVLENQIDEPFVPNDLHCDADADQLLILTGPNMGGKSTFLRQNALIAIMGQIGSFVPADRAEIGLVDRIFTRVGASDNLARGQSTFMVEMIETARILNTATRRSLILLDEVGRGTATFDGLSIAWSVAEYLLTENPRRARTLFATHYQELTKLETLYEGTRNLCVTVGEGGNSILFYHKVLPGVASKSYGIEVARMAGVPAAVIERAREVLRRLERKQLNLTGRNRSSTVPENSLDDLQRALF